MAVIEMETTFGASSNVLGVLYISGYAGDERSIDRGEPEELYLFNLADTTYWRYTSGDYIISYGSNSYSPILIKRSDIILSPNSLKSKITVEVLATNVFALNYVNSVPEGSVSITIYRRHKNSADYKTYWRGYVQGVGFQGENAKIICGLKDTSLSRYGLMRIFSRNCGLTLYSQWCTISDSDTDYLVTGTILTVSSTTITATEFSTKEDGWFKNGKFVTDNGNCNQRIVYHEGTTIRIARPIPRLAVGDTFVANAGCDYLRATCKNKFNNQLNFGGQPWIPSTNPYGGERISARK